MAYLRALKIRSFSASSNSSINVLHSLASSRMKAITFLACLKTGQCKLFGRWLNRHSPAAVFDTFVKRFAHLVRIAAVNTICACQEASSAGHFGEGGFLLHHSTIDIIQLADDILVTVSEHTNIFTWVWAIFTFGARVRIGLRVVLEMTGAVAVIPQSRATIAAFPLMSAQIAFDTRVRIGLRVVRVRFGSRSFGSG